MNRLFRTLQNLTERVHPAQEQETTSQSVAQDDHKRETLSGPMSGFEGRLEVLCMYAERAACYEDELLRNLDEVLDQLAQLQQLMERALDDGEDRNALEYLLLAARLRPQRDLLDKELKSFHAVADDLLFRVTTLTDNAEEAQWFANTPHANPAATYYLDQTMNRLTRYFVLLERVTTARYGDLPRRLIEQINVVVD